MISQSSSSKPSLHPMTVRDQATMQQMRIMVAPSKGKLRGAESRPAFDEIISRTAAPEQVSFHQDRIGDVSGWWCEPDGAPADKAILHLHGGWFNWGTAQAYRNLVGHIARSVQVKAFIPDYALAPERPFPNAADDARRCLHGLFNRGIESVAVTGDSAGGTLALVLLSMMPDNQALVGSVVLSPVTDLTLSGESWTSRADADLFFVRDQAEGLINAYLGGTDPKHPMASPLFGNMRGLPPLRIHVGNDEVLRDDSIRYVERARSAGTDASVDVWEGMAHGFLGQIGRLDAANKALNAIGVFLTERFAGK